MINSNLGVGPMSIEIIEAIFYASEESKRQLMIIASKNQIDYNGGYVEGWTTREFMNFIESMKLKYPLANVLICRDHCGPGFNGIFELDDTYATIKEDISCGFDLIHIDFCNFAGTQEEKLLESKKAIEYCLKLNSKIKLEIGTDVNSGTNLKEEDLRRIDSEARFFSSFCSPEFYVVQTGSLIKEINQVGFFNEEFVEKVVRILKKYNLKLKEHNADYLSKKEIAKRVGLVDALNIAPQLGVVQTMITITKCLEYGIDFEDFLEEIQNGEKWRKWLQDNTENNKFLCGVIAGHYHFSSESYKNILKRLGACEDIHMSIIKAIKETIKNYE
ncbi:class II D-tagatose-bisphosphate aldolase, non-catalytic subunit [Candidatus Pacearchaeota archaeon]|nr:class II D-tagatose-bisphosphate aldolase, non-catalytic subunit [Candidatus Pacearchaeota archaeon]